jgi:hypothetical protein
MVGFGRVKIPCEWCGSYNLEGAPYCISCHRELHYHHFHKNDFEILAFILAALALFVLASFRPMSSTHGPSDDDLVLFDRTEMPKLLEPVKVGSKGHLSPRTNIWSEEADIEKALLNQAPEFKMKQMDEGETFELLYLAKYEVIRFGKSNPQRYFVKFINGPMAGKYGWIMAPIYE